MSGSTGTTSGTSVTIGQIIRQFGEAFIKEYHPGNRVIKLLEAIGNCRTAALGGHFIECKSCGSQKKLYNSCGNSNCPQCQNIKKELWIDKMVHHLLPVKHFHVIFTVPYQLRELFFYNQRKMYDLLFSSVWETIREVTGSGLTGMVAVLHTWGSNLGYHPHVHCLIPKGKLLKGKWEEGVFQKRRFFVDAEKLRRSYKRVFLKNLTKMIEEDILYYEKGLSVNEYVIEKLRLIYSKVESIKDWTVRIEVPVNGVEQIITYLGRYIKRVAITNSRLLDFNKTTVKFTYNKYAEQEKGKAAPKGTREMGGAQFLQQFSQHILPRYFQRVRYYGIYAFRNKEKKQLAYRSIKKVQQSSYEPPLKRELLKKMLGTDPDVCMECGSYNKFKRSIIERDLSQLMILRNYRLTPLIQIRQKIEEVDF